MTPKEKLGELIAMRDHLVGEVLALQNKITGLDMAIAVFQDEYDHREETSNADKQSVKGMLLRLLEEAGATGLNAALAVRTATRRGIDLDRGSVSSMLSRFKREGVVIYDGEKYRLRRYVTRHLSPAEKEAALA